MARVFITGVSGFIGSHLERWLTARGHTVGGTVHAQTLRDTHVRCDIRDPAAIAGALERFSPDVVVHAAALSSVTRGRTLEYYETNVVGTENVIEALKARQRRTRLLFISTAGVYGNQPSETLSEDLAPLPVSHYGMSKFNCERLVLNAASTLDVTIVRPFNVIGPGQDVSFLVPKLVAHFTERRPVIRLGNLDPQRDYIDVQSSCQILEALMFSPASIGETVNMCAGRATSVRELLDLLRSITGHAIDVVVAPEFVRDSEVWKLIGSTAKLDRLVPNRPAPLPLRQVLAEMLEVATAGPCATSTP